MLNYISQKEYSDPRPAYENQARAVRIKAINPNMIGTSVRIDGVVERIHFWYLNRPQFLVGDKSGEISVKMFVSLQEKVVEGGIVGVIGIVMKRYILTVGPVINVSPSARSARPPEKRSPGIPSRSSPSLISTRHP